jgi:hypothetical protein
MVRDDGEKRACTSVIKPAATFCLSKKGRTQQIGTGYCATLEEQSQLISDSPTSSNQMAVSMNVLAGSPEMAATTSEADA